MFKKTNKQYSSEEKRNYYFKRAHDKTLTKGQRDYAAGRYVGSSAASDKDYNEVVKIDKVLEKTVKDNDISSKGFFAGYIDELLNRTEKKVKKENEEKKYREWLSGSADKNNKDKKGVKK